MDLLVRSVIMVTVSCRGLSRNGDRLIIMNLQRYGEKKTEKVTWSLDLVIEQMIDAAKVRGQVGVDVAERVIDKGG